jgi:hypothetical protein
LTGQKGDGKSRTAKGPGKRSSQRKRGKSVDGTAFFVPYVDKRIDREKIPTRE